MFQRIQHIGYLTTDLDGAVDWFQKSFGAVNSGGGPISGSYAVPSGGRNAYVRFGQVEAEIIEPSDKNGLTGGALTMHHVGYVVPDIGQMSDVLANKGFKFAADKPFTNVLGQQVLYFDASTTNGVKVHLTQLPVEAGHQGGADSLQVERIVHAGYRVRDLDQAVAWYVDNLQGQHIGGGRGRTGEIAFVNFGQVQVELICPDDPDTQPAEGHVMDHVGYAVGDIQACIGVCQGRGLKFAGESPNTNPVRQQVLYFDTDTTMTSRMHLTRLPD